MNESLLFLPDLLRASGDYVRLRSKRFSNELGIHPEHDLSAHLSLVLSSWRFDTGTTLSSVIESGAYDIWALMRYLANIYDDVIDSNLGGLPTPSQIRHYPLFDGTTPSDTVSKLVQRIKELPVSDEQRKDIFKILGEFRRYQYELNSRIVENIQRSKPDLSVTETNKLESSGNVMQVMVRIINILAKIDPITALNIEQAYHTYGKAGQWVDDIADFQKDHGDPTNLLVNAAMKNPEELEMMRSLDFSPLSLRKAKKTNAYANKEFFRLANLVPDTFPSMKRSLFFFKSVVPLYRAFETVRHV